MSRYSFVCGVSSLLITALLIAAGPAHADFGDCTQPVSTGPDPVATDCLFILRTAVFLETCNPDCVCAPKGSLPVTATDALLCLNIATFQPVALRGSPPGVPGPGSRRSGSGVVAVQAAARSPQATTA